MYIFVYTYVHLSLSLFLYLFLCSIYLATFYGPSILSEAKPSSHYHFGDLTRGLVQIGRDHGTEQHL